MNGWLESVQEVIATIGHFLHLAVSAVGQLGDTVPQAFTYLQTAFGNLPAPVVGAALLCLVIGIIFLVIGR